MSSECLRVHSKALSLPSALRGILTESKLMGLARPALAVPLLHMTVQLWASHSL